MFPCHWQTGFDRAIMVCECCGHNFVTEVDVRTTEALRAIEKAVQDMDE
ncbi:MAG: hypothetical protein KGR26_00350 [Cyanobacteria bacterium REEB65]|nr:hypothetical protein [Cyanobacteria bacterium REEB65]